MPSTIQPKLLYVKRLRFRSGRNKKFVAPALETLLLAIKKAAPTAIQRHWPLPPAAPQTFATGTSCVYLSNIGTRKDQDGVYFEVGAYVYGRGEAQVTMDLSGAEPDVTSGPIVDAKGNQRAIVHIYRCVALGETLLIENHKGSGGASALIRLLTAMFRQHYDPTLPTIELIDVASGDLRRDIELGGGVHSMTIKVLDGAPGKDDTYGVPLFSLREKVGGTGKLNVIWEADDELDVESVVDAVEESQHEGSSLSGVTLHLNDGPNITQLGRYRARKKVDITVDAHGIPHYGEIKSELFNYLNELRQSKNKWRLIDDSGYFQAGSPVVKTKKKKMS
jgi:hypothetical protein